MGLEETGVLEYKYVDEIYCELENKYERYCDILSTEMNKKHSQNLPMKRWELIFGPWLFFFLHYSYNQWLNSRAKNNSTERFNVWVFHTYSSYMQSINNEEFFEDFQQISGYFIRANELPPPEVVCTKCSESITLKKIISNFIRNILQLKSLLLLRFTPRNIVFCESHLPKKIFSKVSENVPAVTAVKFLARPLFSEEINYSKRQKWDISFGSDEFDVYFANMLKIYMPTAYLEHFHFYTSFPFLKIKKQVLSVTANAIYNNDSYKYFCAVNRQCKIIGVPHGGLDYYVAKHFPYRYLESRIFDQYYPYWKTDSTIVQLPSVRVWSKKISPLKGKKKLLFITTKQDKVLCYYPKIPTYFSQLMEHGLHFLRLLIEVSNNPVIFHKPHFEDNLWGYHKLLHDSFPDNVFLEPSKDIESVRDKYSLFVFDHISTGVLQCLYSRYPFLICLPSTYIDKYYDQTGVLNDLEEIGLLYYDVAEAAKFIGQIENIECWWQSIIRSQVYKNLLDSLGADLDPYCSWMSLISEYDELDLYAE